MKTYTLEQIKAAFIASFLRAGELWMHEGDGTCDFADQWLMFEGNLDTPMIKPRETLFGVMPKKEPLGRDDIELADELIAEVTNGYEE